MKTILTYAFFALAAFHIGQAQPTPVSGSSSAGTVTSVAVSGSDGIDVDSGSPVTSTGTIALGINAATLKTHLSLGNVDNTSDATKNAATATLTNKRITARVTTITSSATPTINTDNCDAVTITALATAITSVTTNLTGTPANFDRLLFRIKDDGTGRAITWGASFVARGATLPTTTTAGKVLSAVFWWNSVTSTWDCMATATES